MSFFSLHDLLVMVLLAIGGSVVITGSKIGFPIRFVWCYAMPQVLWGLVRCPYCNAWWTGLVAGILYSPDPTTWASWLQVAFTSCGIVKVIQVFAPGDGIAMVEDFSAVFGLGASEEPPTTKESVNE